MCSCAIRLAGLPFLGGQEQAGAHKPPGWKALPALQDISSVIFHWCGPRGAALRSVAVALGASPLRSCKTDYAKAAIEQLLGCVSKRQSKPELMAAPDSQNWDNWSWEQQCDAQAWCIPPGAPTAQAPPYTPVHGGPQGSKAGEGAEGLVTIFSFCMLQGFAHTHGLKEPSSSYPSP